LQFEFKGGDHGSTHNVPVEVASDAAARIQELGFQGEFEMMVDHTKQIVTDLLSLEITLYEDPDEPGEPRIVITAWREGPGTVSDPTRSKWVDWYLETFPADICRWFLFEVDYKDNHGG
jgi:hypothetical protein